MTYSHADWLRTLNVRTRILKGDEEALAAIRRETRTYYGLTTRDVTDDAPIYIFCGMFVKGDAEKSYQVPDATMRRHVHRPPHPADPVARWIAPPAPAAPAPEPGVADEEPPTAEPPVADERDPAPEAHEPETETAEAADSGSSDDAEDASGEGIVDQRVGDAAPADADDDGSVLLLTIEEMIGPDADPVPQPTLAAVPPVPAPAASDAPALSDDEPSSIVNSLPRPPKTEGPRPVTPRDGLIGGSRPVEGEPEGLAAIRERTRLFFELPDTMFPMDGELRWFADGIYVLDHGDDPAIFQAPMDRLADIVIPREAPTLPWIAAPTPVA